MIIKNGRKKRIVLIESRSPGSHIFSMVLLPRVGIVLLATMLKNMGYEVVVFVENFHEIDWNMVREADLVGISTITCTTGRGYEIASKCREMGKTVVIGGSHATFMADEATRYADYVCIGEAEWSFPKLVDAILREDADPKKINGVAYRENGQFIKTPEAQIVTASDLDRFPFPDFSLIYGKPKMKITPIMSSRGCPHNCDFCSVIVMFGREMRYRSRDNVIDEMRYQNPNYVFFFDDNFTINPKRTTEILEDMLRFPKSKRFNWSAQVDVGVARNRELVRLMKKSGCEYVYVGFESIIKETLEAYNKKQDIDKIRNCIEVFHAEGVNVHGMFVFDSRNDDKSAINETMRFIKETKIETVQLLNLTPLPGTPLWSRVEKDLLTRDWSLFDAHHVVLSARKMTEYDLQMETVNAMKKFYSLSGSVSSLWGGNSLVAKFRALGWNIARQWEKNNEDFLKFLKTLSENK